MNRIRLWLLIVLGILLANNSTSFAATVNILCPHQKPSGPILMGILELERVMKSQGWVIRRSFGKVDNKASFDMQIVVMPFDSQADLEKEAEMFKDVIPVEPESLSIIKAAEDKGLRYYALGSDPVGAMYASYELAEQIERSVQIPIEQRVVEIKRSPSIPNRGIQLMIHRQALDDPYSWFHSESFWHGFIKKLSLSRFNYLELQGVYDLVTAQFTNLLPYLIPSQTLHKTEDVTRNLKSVQRIIQMAHQYGLTLSLINSGIDWGEEDSSSIDRAVLQTTMLDALNGLLKACPDLDGIGLMASDESLPVGFYHNTYVQAINHSVNKPLFVLRTEAADPEQVVQLVDNNPNRSVLEIKFNGDHMILPYPVTGNRMCQWPGYSYQNYFNTPRKYGILFEFPFNGTHRVFPWGDAVFIRKALANATYSGANGFVLQTYSTFLPHADAYTNPIRSDLRYYDWTYQRDWYWYLLWGRLAYDAELPNTFFERKFQEHFGDQAGSLLFQSLQKASRMIPAIGSVCFAGPSKSDFAPELEPPRSLEEIIQLKPLDSFTIRSITEEVFIQLNNKIDGRLSPMDILAESVTEAEEAAVLAQQAGTILQSATGSVNSSSIKPNVDILKEWNAWLYDFQALAALGQYWRDRVGAAIQLEIYQQTGDIPSLIIASEKLTSSEIAWKDVQKYTTLHYRPMLDALRNKTSRFHWKLMPAQEEKDRLTITELYNAWLNTTEWTGGFGHYPVRKVAASSSALLTISIPPKIKVDSMFVQYQNQVGETARFPLASTQLEGVFYTELNPSVLMEGKFQYFFIGKRTEWGDSWVIPEGRLPFAMVVTDDVTPPFCSHLEHLCSKSGSRVFVTAKFTDPAGLESVSVWWKPLPSDAQWTKVIMEGVGEIFQGHFPITKAGAQYAIEAVDRFGNVIRIPDVKNENPYRTIPPSLN